MCMQDIQIGRSTQFSESVVTIDFAAPSPLVGADPLRIALLIGQPSADGIRITQGVVPSATVGMQLLSTTDKPLELNLHNAGAALFAPWQAIATGAAPVTVLVISVSLAARTADQLPGVPSSGKGVR